jgi:hypothetical protein
MRAMILAAALLAAAPALAHAQTSPAPAAAVAQPSPRETVTAVAGRIRDLYFDPAAGDRIADALESEAAAGAFDGLTDRRDLAATLSRRLRPLDAHFNVAYDPNAPTGSGPRVRVAPRPDGPAPDGPRPLPVAPPGGASPDALSHYGFRRAEILPGNIGYIEIRGFSNIDFDDPADPARKAADAALDFVSGTDAVIFDVRDNGGGAPSMVGYLTSAFTPAGADIYNTFHERDGTSSEAPRAYRAEPRLTVPVYVLISARSGSAAEAFPYTLQAAGRATIVGEASGGAANPGGMVPVGGGFAVFISMGSPKNPITGRNWEGTGVLPDVSVPWDQALTRAHTLALETIVAADSRRRDAAWALEAMNATAPAGDLSPYAGAFGEQSVAVVGDKLQITRGRRPPVTLARLGNDLFTVVGDPTRRVQFTRDGSGRVTTMDQLSLGGPGPRARRTD